jgi:hypothetical protein
VLRSRIAEVHFICPFDSIASVLADGIWCKLEQRKRYPNAPSVADPEVQKRRAAKVIPNGGRLHSYANVYFDARNSMMSTLRHLNDTLAILRVSDAVVDLPDVIVSDRNAAADDVIFRPAAQGVQALDESEVYAVWWNMSRDAKQRRCAEVLVPTHIPPQHILGAYVRTEACKAVVAAMCPPNFPITVKSDLYF